MTERDFFGALVRWFGVILAAYGAYALIYEVLKAVGLEVTSRVPLTTGLVFGAVYLGFGVILLFGGGAVVRIVYGREK